MNVVGAMLLVFSMVRVPQSCGFPKEDLLDTRQDWNDVVITTSVTMSGPGHMVVKSYEIDAKNHVTLKYCLFQSTENSQLQSLQTIKIEWRLKGVRLSDLR